MDEDKDRYEKHMERIRAQKRQVNVPLQYAPPTYAPPTYAPPTYAPPTYAESQRMK
jgi:hypothetical protein